MTNLTTDEKCRIVYEFYTGECATFTVKASIGDNHRYIKDEVKSLATSLDAWAEYIWPVMSDEQTKQVDSIIYELVLHGELKAMWQATAMHHLEAALTAIGGE